MLSQGCCEPACQLDPVSEELGRDGGLDLDIDTTHDSIPIRCST